MSETHEQLKACPYLKCGKTFGLQFNENVSDKPEHFVECCECGTCGPTMPTKSKAANAWNHLATPTPPSSREEIDLKDVPICGDCNRPLGYCPQDCIQFKDHDNMVHASSREAELEVIERAKKIDRLSYCHCEQHEGRLMQCPPCDLNDALKPLLAKALSGKGEG